MQLKNLERILANPDPLTQREVEFNMAILQRINKLLAICFKGKQKDLAIALGVSEAAVSKMLNGYQNFEIKTLHKLEQAFGRPIIGVLAEEDDPVIDYVPIATHATIRSTLQIEPNGQLQAINYTKSIVKSVQTTDTDCINNQLISPNA
jgi:transcriptional regulator with XRE-family HTH domain